MLGALKPRHARHLSRASGLTLVEAMVGLAILGVLVAVAIPSLRGFIERKRLEGLAQDLITDLRLIKAQQIQTRSIYGTAIGISSNQSKTCYMLYTQGSQVPNCNCALAAELACGQTAPGGIAPAPIRQVDLPRSDGIILASSRAVLVMDSYNGLPRSGNVIRITLTSSTAGQLVVTTNPTGAPSLCSASGSFSAIKPCE